jgi:hypothetical protein
VRLLITRNINNTWQRIGEVISSSSGTASMELKAGTYYVGNASLSGYNNDSKTFTTSDSPQLFVLSQGSSQNYFLWLRGTLVSACTLTNTSSYVTATCTLNDTMDITSYVQISVNKLSPYTQMCLNTTAVETGNFYTLSCTIPRTNDTYSFIFTAVTTQGSYPLITRVFTFESYTDTYGTEGIFFTMMLFLVMSLVFMWNPVAGILGGLLALDASYLMGVFYLGSDPFTPLISINLVGITLMFILESRRGS